MTYDGVKMKVGSVVAALIDRPTDHRHIWANTRTWCSKSWGTRVKRPMASRPMAFYKNRQCIIHKGHGHDQGRLFLSMLQLQFRNSLFKRRRLVVNRALRLSSVAGRCRRGILCLSLDSAFSRRRKIGCREIEEHPGLWSV